MLNGKRIKLLNYKNEYLSKINSKIWNLKKPNERRGFLVDKMSKLLRETKRVTSMDKRSKLLIFPIRVPKIPKTNTERISQHLMEKRTFIEIK